MNTERMVIVDGVRTPFCKAGTELAAFGADELGRIAVNSLLTRTGLDPALVDEVIFGCVAQPPESANLARIIALRAGIPEKVPAVTVHRNCASGFEAVTQAYEKMCNGRRSIFVVGGTESMSNIPLLFLKTAAVKFARLARTKTFGQRMQAMMAFRPADFKPRPGLLLGLTDPVCGMTMGETAELLARELQISRAAQDEFALRSHQRAAAARNWLAEEICPVFQAGKSSVILTDNGVREQQSPEALAQLKPIFDRKYGTVTAGNSSQVTDGAVALLVMSEKRARELKCQPLGVLTGYAYAGCDPKRMGLGPVHAIALAEKQIGLKLSDADLIEVNEAFAAQILAVVKSLGDIPAEKLNVNGGAIALGHPVGATGARLVLTALKELQRRRARRALVSACVGGGQGAALWLERI
jgi:acetyl-CoA C-acetyltransferase/acetyl-CoA acyltransferase